MESRIRSLYLEILDIFKDIDRKLKDLSEARLKGRSSIIQQLEHSIKHKKHKLDNIRLKFKNLTCGYILKIKYLCGSGEVKEAILVNLSYIEAEDLIKLYCSVKGIQFIKILEIHSIPTKLG